MAVALSGTENAVLLTDVSLPGKQVRSLSFGAYAAATSSPIQTNFVFDRAAIIDKVQVIVGTKPSTSGANLDIYRRIHGTDGTTAAAVSAARKVITTKDLNGLTNLTLTDCPLAQADRSGGDTTQKCDNNYINPGESLVFALTGTQTALVDLFILVSYRYIARN